MGAKKRGKLFVVGTGPGAVCHLTPAARTALEEAETVIGYRTYLDLIEPIVRGKKIVSSGMRQEIERCRTALGLAGEGEIVALVSGGDAGVYGMAGLVLELAGSSDTDIEIVPAVSAVQAAAARLGAPLMHDFAVISLSDLLTPWPLIRQRIEAAAAADFVIALYNPRSKGRPDHLDAARNIILRHRAAETPVGIVRHATRREESVSVGSLAGFDCRVVDMFSLVLIGNSGTRVDANGRLVTPRGYHARYQESGFGIQDEVPNPEAGNRKPEKCRALFIGGTGSDVGKSVIVAGLCRIFKDRGLSVAPFKAQNMALNSAVTPDGGEIGRAQAMQAAACRVEPHVDMNPVLLKPNSDTGSQVVLLGRPRGNRSVVEYHAEKKMLFDEVEAAYRRLAERHELIVLEGAGSIAEINLKEHDLTNLKAASMARAPVLLVADIDRGGVFASLVGTIGLLSPEERQQVKGLIINRFRGDPDLLKPGLVQLEDRTGLPVVGVIPWIDLNLPEEDSVALARQNPACKEHAVQVGVVRLPRISNYTDFDSLAAERDVELHYLEHPGEVAGCDLLILPGTKSTLADLNWLRQSGFDAAIRRFRAGGKRIIGICGGFQMLGGRLSDPDRVESEHAGADGLDLLDISTRLTPHKQTHRVEAEPLPGWHDTGMILSGSLAGYEIHMGESTRGALAEPLFRLASRSGRSVDLEDGAVSADGLVWGTYLHGLFDNATFRHALIETLWRDRGQNRTTISHEQSLDRELDRLAEHLQTHLDLQKIFSLLDIEG